MKKNGFTLIELLAVIVILAIIALIATPIVLNIIEDSKKSSKLSSANHYLDGVEQAIMKYNIDNDANFVPNTCEIQESGNLKCDEKDIFVEVKGEVPTKGTIVLKDGKIEDTFLVFNDKNIVIDKNGSLETVATPISFEKDSWETIVANVKAGNSSVYKVGDTKEISLTGFTNAENGTYTIRIANVSSDDKVCTTVGNSQTACGFVIEFEDVIADHIMNYSNKGGWEESKVRTYLNETIYSALPQELKEKIIVTTVISGHGSTSGETNFITEDKLYLLSTKEVWGKKSYSNAIVGDSAENETRQLDYYEGIGVTTANPSGAAKKYKGSEYSWWLRTASCSGSTTSFYSVYRGGTPNVTMAYQNNIAVSPAFRIG